MTDEEFCKIETGISGEEINKVEQLAHCSFTGRELKEYLEQAFVIYNAAQQRELLIAYEVDHNCRRRERAEQMVDYYLIK